MKAALRALGAALIALGGLAAFVGTVLLVAFMFLGANQPGLSSRYDDLAAASFGLVFIGACVGFGGWVLCVVHTEGES